MESDHVCKLCLRARPLVEAHIIPRAFYRDMMVDETPVALFSTTAGVMPKRAPTGIYDSHMVCQECEARFNPWDTAGVEFMRRSLTEFDVTHTTDRFRACVPRSFDYPRVKLFFMSLLWRAHATTHEFFGDVALGPFEAPLRSMILSSDPGRQEDFGVVALRYEGEPGPFIESPRRLPRGESNGYLFHFGRHDITIYVDRRTPRTDWFGQCALSPGQPPVLLVSPMLGGPWTKRLYRMANKFREMEASWRSTPKALRMIRGARTSQ